LGSLGFAGGWGRGLRRCDRGALGQPAAAPISALRWLSSPAAAESGARTAQQEGVKRKAVTWYGARISTDPTAPSVIRRRPTTPSQRHTAIIDKTYLWRGAPHKALTKGIKRSGGRNNQGCITVRGKGGGNKRKYRLVDFKRAHPLSTGVVRGIVERIEYDPNRTALIALLRHAEAAEGYEGQKHAPLSYIVCPRGVAVGHELQASRSGAVDVKPGNSMQLRHIPVGTLVHNIELKPGASRVLACSRSRVGCCPCGRTVRAVAEDCARLHLLDANLCGVDEFCPCLGVPPLLSGGGAQLCRSAGTSAQLLERDETRGLALLRMQSKEQRYVRLSCMATVGEVSNPEHKNQTLGKAGRSRWMGRRPKVRGVAMNPVDHPNGGGEGKKSGKGLSPWGMHSKGFKTVRKVRPYIKLQRWKAKKTSG
jgi:large subunit ribosomal protein L2